MRLQVSWHVRLLLLLRKVLPSKAIGTSGDVLPRSLREPQESTGAVRSACGSTRLQNYAAALYLSYDAEQIDPCCIKHDACYNKCKGQVWCDTAFQDCMVKNCQASKAHDERCLHVASLFTDLVRNHGHDTYKSGCN